MRKVSPLIAAIALAGRTIEMARVKPKPQWGGETSGTKRAERHHRCGKRRR